MFLRAALTWLPMQLLLLWGQIWMLRVSHMSSLGELLVATATLSGIAAIAWYALPWILQDDDRQNRVAIGALWAGSTLAGQLSLAAASFGTWERALQALTVGGVLNVGNMSMVLMVSLPMVAAYWRHRPVTEPTQPTPVREAPRGEMVVATASN